MKADDLYDVIAKVLGFVIISHRAAYELGEVEGMLWGKLTDFRYICIGSASQEEWEGQLSLMAAVIPGFAKNNVAQLANPNYSRLSAFIRERK